MRIPWRIDHVDRDPRDGSVVQITEGPIIFSYDTASGAFYYAFDLLGRGASLRLMRGTYDTISVSISWRIMREAWA